MSINEKTTALFVTCLVDQLFPQVGEAALRLLETCGRKVEFPTAQTCCGQPAFNMGHGDEARRLAKRMIEIFEPYDEVVTPSGSCASMVRVHFQELLQDDAEWHGRAERLAAMVFELTELLSREGYDASCAHFPCKAAYHPSCHLLRELKVREEPRALLRQVRGLELVELENADVCCGFGGAFSAKMPELSGAMLEAKLEAVEAAGAPVLTATDCGCLMHLEGALKRRRSASPEGGRRNLIEVRHIAEILVGED